MAHTVTDSGWKRIATVAGAVIVDDGNGWSHIVHPTTRNILQRDPDSYVSVHADGGSWGSGVNTVSTITRIWRGEL
jgi:hypothetical protein